MGGENTVNLSTWSDMMKDSVEGNVRITRVMQSVPLHEDTVRYQVYNEERTYDEVFDLKMNGDQIISIDGEKVEQ